MLIRQLFRHNAALWVSPFLLLISLYYAHNILPATPVFYPLAITNAAAWTLAISAPVLAACAAWEGGRIHQSNWFVLPHVRSVAAFVFVHVIPIIIVGTATLILTVIYKFLALGRLGMPDLRVIALATIVIAALSLLGFAIGVWSPPVISVPTVFIATWCWMALTPAMSPLWVRHLTGSFSGCCSLSTDIPPRAFAGSLLMASGFVVSSIILFQHSWRRSRFALAAIPTVLLFSAGAALVHGMGPNAVVPRSASNLVCQPGNPSVCLWREHQSRLDDVSLIATNVAINWKDAGVPVPSKFTEQWQKDNNKNERSFLIALNANNSEIVVDLTNAVIPLFPACAQHGPWPGGQVQNAVRVWLAEDAGVVPTSLDHQFNPRDLAIASSVHELPIAQQRAWIRQNLAALQSCTVQPLVGTRP